MSKLYLPELETNHHHLETEDPFSPSHQLDSRKIAGTRVDASNYDETVSIICDWSLKRESRYVCVSTVHMVMEGHDNPEYQRIVNNADLVTSDGMPLVWGLRLLGAKHAQRVYGPDLTPLVCEKAADLGIRVGFYGSTTPVLSAMIANLKNRYPTLQVVYQHSPPFRKLTAAETAQEVRDIEESGAQIIFVGLGCPKQEEWMASRRDRINGVMVGVGAAFDFLAGTKSQAPDWMQSAGLEWVFRLATEPRRLWHRYLYNNPRFTGLFLLQLVQQYRINTVS